MMVSIMDFPNWNVVRFQLPAGILWINRTEISVQFWREGIKKGVRPISYEVCAIRKYYQ